MQLGAQSSRARGEERGRCPLHPSPWDPWVESDSRKEREDGTRKAPLGQDRDQPDCRLGIPGNVEGWTRNGGVSKEGILQEL